MYYNKFLRILQIEAHNCRVPRLPTSTSVAKERRTLFQFSSIKNCIRVSRTISSFWLNSSIHKWRIFNIKSIMITKRKENPCKYRRSRHLSASLLALFISLILHSQNLQRVVRWLMVIFSPATRATWLKFFHHCPHLCILVTLQNFSHKK